MRTPACIRAAAMAGAITALGFWALPPAFAENTEILNEVFKGRPVEDGNGLIAIDMPARAEDAAIVPVTLRSTLAPGDARAVRAFTLIVDQNPAPLAATHAGQGEAPRWQLFEDYNARNATAGFSQLEWE